MRSHVLHYDSISSSVGAEMEEKLEACGFVFVQKRSIVITVAKGHFSSWLDADTAISKLLESLEVPDVPG